MIILYGFLAGLVTGLSPCIIPVLPAIVAGSVTPPVPTEAVTVPDADSESEDSDASEVHTKGKLPSSPGPGKRSGASPKLQASQATPAAAPGPSRGRPYVIVAGLVVSFSVITLAGGSLLHALHLPTDVLEDVGIGLLLALAVGMFIPQIGVLIERPFARLGVKPRRYRNGFVLGLSLGLVFTPCAGPVLAAISTIVAKHRIGPEAVLLTFAYAIGTAVPLLTVALLAKRAGSTWKQFRRHLPTARRVAGVVLALTGIAILFTWTSALTAVPGYVSSLENSIAGSGSAAQSLKSLEGDHGHTIESKVGSVSLSELGQAPNFTKITAWLNTPDGKPLDLSGLRGKVVLVDFWTYSCINCRRSIPHVEAWYRDYEKDGLVVVGVHTPEFPFEHVVSNVKSAIGQLGITYPVAVDDTYGTWTAYENQYWPAEYLIDQNGNIRYTDFGEGNYGTMEKNIRLLLSATSTTALPPAVDVPTRTPTQMLSPETYLGSERFTPTRYDGTPNVVPKVATEFHMPTKPVENDVSFGGTWTQTQWDVIAGSNASIQFSFGATDVYLVLGGTGTVTVSENGGASTTTHVAGIPDLYTLVSSSKYETGVLTLRMTPGVQAYDFTFG